MSTTPTDPHPDPSTAEPGGAPEPAYAPEPPYDPETDPEITRRLEPQE